MSRGGGPADGRMSCCKQEGLDQMVPPRFRIHLLIKERRIFLDHFGPETAKYLWTKMYLNPRHTQESSIWARSWGRTCVSKGLDLRKVIIDLRVFLTDASEPSSPPVSCPSARQARSVTLPSQSVYILRLAGERRDGSLPELEAKRRFARGQLRVPASIPDHATVRMKAFHWPREAGFESSCAEGGNPPGGVQVGPLFNEQLDCRVERQDLPLRKSHASGS